MLCFTSPTKNRSSLRLIRFRMASWTALLSWYSSTMMAVNRSRYSAAASSFSNIFAQKCSRSLKSIRSRSRFMPS